jgi:hypothetical protein
MQYDIHIPHHVKRSAYMDFKKVTDELFKSISHDELADAVGVSVASIRQARLDGDAKAHRSPPPGWEKAVLKLAETRARHFERLVDRLRAGAL